MPNFFLITSFFVSLYLRTSLYYAVLCCPAEQRDHYEGTDYDLTQGIQSGPYGDPNRFDSTPVDNLTREDILQGSYERAISLFRTSYSIVAVARSNIPDSLALLWLCQYAPSSSSYAPFYLASTTVPTPYSK